MHFCARKIARTRTFDTAPFSSLGLLQAVEALKKEVKASYRGGDRAFIDEIDPLAWGLFAAQQKEKKQDLGALRHLRGELLQTLAPSAEALAACKVRTSPEEDTAVYSSDEETQLLSDQEHCPRAAALVKGIGEELKDQAEGVLEDLLDPSNYVVRCVELLLSLPEIPGLLVSYIEEVIFEEDEEKQAEMVGKLVTRAVFLVAQKKVKVGSYKALQKTLQLSSLQSSLGKKVLEELRKWGQGGVKGGKQISKYAAYRANWEKRSFKEAIQKFAPGVEAVLGKKPHKMVYLNKQTRVKITYDTKGKYFRIKDGEGYPLDWNGKRVHRLKGMSDQQASDFVLKNSHFNDID